MAARPKWRRERSEYGDYRYVLETIGIRPIGWKQGWYGFHVPTGLGIFSAKYLDDAKRFAVTLRERFDLSVCDRYAANDYSSEDERTIEAIKRLIVTTEGISR